MRGETVHETTITGLTMHVRMYIRMSEYIRKYVCIHSSSLTPTGIPAHAYVHICMYTHMYMYTHIDVRTSFRWICIMYTHVCTQPILTYLVHVHMHTRTHARMHIHTHIHMHARTHTRMHTHTYTHTHTHTHTHTQTHTHTHTHTHTQVHM